MVEVPARVPTVVKYRLFEPTLIASPLSQRSIDRPPAIENPMRLAKMLIALDLNQNDKALMGYVGWRDMKSALRYVDSSASFGQLAIKPASPQPSIISETPTHQDDS
ncbi:hypothetical protein CU666_05190 [Pseudomonas syringae pv. actinidifoliorum]|nr:hypothetical protein [Pseudomonas syringae pv. actinidifoliorum]NAT57804.1 hypothetical protein [Pseudomonas syringae pv. actinidifoliorum]